MNMNHLPQGECRQADGDVLWRVWAPNCKRMYLITPARLPDAADCHAAGRKRLLRASRASR